MKRIFALILLAVMVLTVAHAADPNATMPLPGAPITVGGYSGSTSNKVAALTTNAYFTITASEQTDLALFINVKYLNAVGAGDVNRLDLQLFRGIDGTTFESNAWQTISFAANATTTTASSTVTNIAVAGIPTLRGRFINVSTNSHVTNLLFQVRAKTPAFKSR